MRLKVPISYLLFFIPETINEGKYKPWIFLFNIFYFLFSQSDYLSPLVSNEYSLFPILLFLDSL